MQFSLDNHFFSAIFDYIQQMYHFLMVLLAPQLVIYYSLQFDIESFFLRVVQETVSDLRESKCHDLADQDPQQMETKEITDLLLDYAIRHPLRFLFCNNVTYSIIDLFILYLQEKHIVTAALIDLFTEYSKENQMDYETDEE